MKVLINTLLVVIIVTAGVEAKESNPYEVKSIKIELDTNKENEKNKEEDESEKILNEAFAKFGIKNIKDATPKQLQDAREYVAKAMFPKRKKEILEKAKNAKFLKSCYKNANNMQEAKACDPENEELYRWNKSVKNRIVTQMSEIEKALPCVEKASNEKEIESCFPKD